MGCIELCGGNHAAQGHIFPLGSVLIYQYLCLYRIVTDTIIDSHGILCPLIGVG